MELCNLQSLPNDTVPFVKQLRERIIKQNADNIYNVTSDVDSYAEHRKKFINAGLCETLSSIAPGGLTNYAAYKKIAENENIRHLLVESGLHGDEVTILSDYITGDISNTSSSKMVIPDDIKTARFHEFLQCIDEKIAKRQKLSNSADCECNSSSEYFSGAIPVSKQTYEMIARDETLVNSNQMRTIDCISSKVLFRPVKRLLAVHPAHPLNHLSTLSKEVFQNMCCSDQPADSCKNSPHVVDVEHWQSFKTFSEKPDYKEKSYCCTETFKGNNNTNNYSHDVVSSRQERTGFRRKTMWDVNKSDRKAHVSENTGMVVGLTNKSDDYRSINLKLSKEFVCIPDLKKLIPLSEIKSRCVSQSELNELFPKLAVGKESSTLYIKNLSKSARREDLINIFGHFDSGPERAVYRIMTGRLRGQAFIKFPTKMQATAALKHIQGYILSGKPIAIEYGKQ